MIIRMHVEGVGCMCTYIKEWFVSMYMCGVRGYIHIIYTYTYSPTLMYVHIHPTPTYMIGGVGGIRGYSVRVYITHRVLRVLGCVLRTHMCIRLRV